MASQTPAGADLAGRAWLLLRAAPTMLAGRRVAVHVCRLGGFPRRARFEQSIVGHCCPPHEDSGIVHCALKPLQFLVSDQEFPGSTELLLKRPPFCPIKHLTREQRASLPAETRHRGVDVGVAVLLESANQKILLTRRARTLSLFPNAWVPPGGHIEPEEELLDAGLRELEEETGLWLQDGEFSWHLLALWESVYPPRLSQGLPQRHHIVIYLHLVLHENHQQLQARLKPNEAEVSAVAWLDRPTLASIVATEDGAEGEILRVGKGAPSTVSIIELDKDSSKTLVIPTTTFLATAQGEDMEHVSTGTKKENHSRGGNSAIECNIDLQVIYPYLTNESQPRVKTFILWVLKLLAIPTGLKAKRP